MGAQATRLSDVKVKAAKPKEKDYILTDGDGLQMRVRANGADLEKYGIEGAGGITINFLLAGMGRPIPHAEQ